MKIMKAIDIIQLIEKIQQAPRDTEKYFKIKLKAINDLEKNLLVLRQKVDKLSGMKSAGLENDDLEYYMIDFLGEKYFIDDVKELLGYFLDEKSFGDSYIVRFKRDLKEMLDLYNRADDCDAQNLFRTIFKGLRNSIKENYLHIENITGFIENIRELFSINQGRIKDQLDYVKKDKDKYGLKVYDLIQSIPPVLDQFEKFHNDVKAKFAELDKMIDAEEISSIRGGPGYVPDHDKVETLYHASLYAKDLARNGFDKKYNNDRVGVGGATEGISFSSDYKITQDIARAFKEVKMIFDGKLKWNQIIDWARREHIDIESGRKCPFLKAYPPENLMDTVALYRCYLTYSKIRESPVFWINDDKKFIRAFQKVKMSNIGIVKAKVDLSNPEIKYMKGEREFRVPAESVLDVKLVR